MIVVHYVPRFAACTPQELGEAWQDVPVDIRITSLIYQDGTQDVIAEDKDNGREPEDWVKTKPWGGQTVFTFRERSHKGSLYESSLSSAGTQSGGNSSAATPKQASSVPTSPLQFSNQQIKEMKRQSMPLRMLTSDQGAAGRSSPPIPESEQFKPELYNIGSG